MKKVFRIALWSIGGLVGLVACIAAYIQIKGLPSYPELTAQIPKDYKVEVTPERVARGQKIAVIDCNVCHLSNEEAHLSGKLLKDIPTEFGKAYSKNITNDPVKGIGQWTDGELAFYLRTGLRSDGSYVPLYMPKFPLLSDEDMAAVIAYLRSTEGVVQASKREPPESEPSFLTKALCHFVMKPHPFNAGSAKTPPLSDEIAHGKYLADAVFGCTSCHSADFKKNNELNPPLSPGYCGGGNALLDMEGNIIKSSNISPDKETGIGNWTTDEFIAAVKYGKGKGGQLLRYPMEPKTTLDSAEIKAIFVYLKTVPPVKNTVDKSLTKAGM